MSRHHIIHGDVRTVLTMASMFARLARWLWPHLPDIEPFFDAAMGDPPYGLIFMSTGWDRGVADVWRELMPHLRPGAPVAMFGGTRTYHRLATEIEDAGFEILTCDEAICGPGDPRDIEHKPGCHVFELDRQGGGRDEHGNLFFYCAKVSTRERSVSAHQCMKPIKLTEYLARLLLPPPRADGRPRVLLVPFSGSGSEMIGALAAGWDVVVGIEWDAGCDNPGKRPDYWADVAEYRIAEHQGALKAEHIKPDIGDAEPVQMGLF